MSARDAAVPASVLRIGGDAAFAALVAEAVRRAFGGGEVRTAAGVTEAAGAAGDGAGLAVLCDPSREALERIGGAADEGRLPRWAVVVAGAAPEGIETPDALPREQWSVEALARALRGAWSELRLRRENARLRGSLAAFGHRVAHDLRTPLGGILTTTEMLREVLGEDCPADVPLTQPILDSTDGLVKLIERVSFFAKALASHEPLQRLRMGEPFWNAFQQLESHLLKKGLVLQQPAEWPSVTGHAIWLEAVWRNLIDNAVQHGGTRVEAGWAHEAGEVRFWLRDNGSVAPEKRATLFFPFHRLHEPGAPRGLGLPIVRELVERQGGACGYQGGADGGSEFYFRLPA